MKIPESQKIFVIFIVVTSVLCTRSPAAHVLFTDEAEFIVAVDAFGYEKVFESFEASVWNPTRGDGTSGSLLSQGLSWSASTNLATTDIPGWVRTGSYALFDNPGEPDVIEITGQQLYAVGGYFIEWDQLDIHFLLDGDSVGYFGVGPDRYRFCGVIEPDGFSSITIEGTGFLTLGNWSADDFIIAVPEPTTLLLLGLGAVMLRRKRS